MNGEKIRLMLCVSINDWKEEYRRGMKVGDIEGMKANHDRGRKKIGNIEVMVEIGGEDALLCQMEPFVLYNEDEGHDGEVLEQMIVEFIKDKGEVYVDWDGDPDAGTLIEDKARTYESLDMEKMKEKGCHLFGSFVKEIRKEEIVEVHYVRSGDEGEEDIRRLMVQMNK